MRCRRRSAPPRARARTPARCSPRSAASAATSRASKAELDGVQGEVRDFLLGLPNLTHASTPVGRRQRRQRRGLALGHAARRSTFRSKDHTDVGEALGLLDFATAAKLSGARFSFLRGDLARLHRALAQFMLDTHTREHGYVECYTPYIVNAETLVGTTQLPKFEADMFSVRKGGVEGAGETLYLISTSEITLTNTVRGEILPADALPIKLTAHTPCFRSEAGQLRQGHARDDPPAPVRQGRAGPDRPSRAIVRGARGAGGPGVERSSLL